MPASIPGPAPAADMQSFTATGRSFEHAQRARSTDNSAAEGLNAADSFGTGAPNLLPVRFTDASIISVPVLRPEDVGVDNNKRHDATDPANTDGKGRRRSFFRRKSSTPNGPTPGFGKASQNFTMRQMPRGEYLARYAKDEQGRYVGTAEPADDCILRGEDLVRYRDRGEKKAFGHGVPRFENEVRASDQVDGAAVQIDASVATAQGHQGEAHSDMQRRSGRGFMKGFRAKTPREGEDVIR